MEQLCREFGYSRQAYYKHCRLSAEQQNLDTVVLAEIRRIRRRQPKVGCRKLQRMVNQSLEAQGMHISRDRMFDLLRSKCLLIKQRKRLPRTTDSYHRFRVYNNLIANTSVSRPNQVFVADITYLDAQEGFSYLFLLTDLYSRKIVGYSLSRTLEATGALQSLRMALRRIENTDGIIHHSDQGSQYCCNAYIKQLKTAHMQISMTQEDHAAENSVAERLNGILKQEFLFGILSMGHEELKKCVDEAVEIYNQERLHMAIDYQTPEEKYGENCVNYSRT